MNQSINTNLWRVQIFRSLLLSSLRVSIPPSNSECTIVTDDITRFIQIVCRRPQLWAVSNASNIKLKKLYLYLWWVLDLNPFLSRNFEDSPFWKLDYVLGGSTFLPYQAFTNVFWSLHQLQHVDINGQYYTFIGLNGQWCISNILTRWAAQRIHKVNKNLSF